MELPDISEKVYEFIDTHNKLDEKLNKIIKKYYELELKYCKQNLCYCEVYTPYTENGSCRFCYGYTKL
jgi:hypothetical protein